MSPRNDGDEDMTKRADLGQDDVLDVLIDDVTADALLRGDDVDDRFAALVSVLDDLRGVGDGGPPAPSAALAALLDGTSEGPPAPRVGRAPRRRRRALRVAGGVGLAAKLAIGGGAAAAALGGAGIAGVLPAPAQSVVDEVIGAVTGVFSPREDDEAPKAPTGPGSPAGTGTDADRRADGTPGSADGTDRAHRDDPTGQETPRPADDHVGGATDPTTPDPGNSTDDTDGAGTANGNGNRNSPPAAGNGSGPPPHAGSGDGPPPHAGSGTGPPPHAANGNGNSTGGPPGNTAEGVGQSGNADGPGPPVSPGDRNGNGRSGAPGHANGKSNANATPDANADNGNGNSSSAAKGGGPTR